MKPPNRQSRWHKFVFFYGILLTFLTAAVFIYQPSFLSLVGQKVYDSMLRSLPENTGNSLPVIVDLDEKTLAEFGQWPWPRYRVALLLDKINMLSPSTIGLDMLFAEPDRTSLDVVQKELLRDLNIDVSFNTDAPLENNDQLLARSMAEAPVVLGYNFFFDSVQSSKQSFLHPIEVIIKHDASFSGTPSLFEARNVTANLPELSSAVQSSGFLNYPADDDGI